ncbi:MAG TPA: GNAT family N-acetyltransferase [Mycobacteriales bacterium]|jgi:predicted GNAT family N-acyltransferase|nr:GNAT family N-acetyltransferase [Mycobacteriales bacterium]
MLTVDPALLAAAARLRHDVFVVGQGVDSDLEADGADGEATHSVVLTGDQVVATGRMVAERHAGLSWARLGRIAVRPDQRGLGRGAQVVRDLELAAAAGGLPRLRLHAQEPVVGFYRRLGWHLVGDPDVEAGIAHRWMQRDLLPGLRPVRDADATQVQALIGGCFAEYPGCVLELDGLDRWMRAPAARYAANGGQLWVLPGEDTELAASCGWVPDGPEAELKSLYVGARYRRRGYAAALVGLVERAARERGADRLRLWSDSRFLDAHRLYTRLGFTRRPETRELHDSSNSTEVGFVKPLSGQNRESPAG